YDNNHITIDGKTRIAYEDDVAARFMGYGWNVTRVGDANDLALIAKAFEEFEGEQGRPTLVVVDSHIGWGSPPKQAAPEAHGGARDQGRRGLARGCPVPRPRGRQGALRRRRRQARRRAAGRLGREAGGPRPPRGRSGRRDRGDAEARPPRRLGRRRPQLRARR